VASLRAIASRPYGTIDIMSLYSKSKLDTWNDYLTRCYKTRNIRELEKMTHRLCVGMDDLAKDKLNSQEMINFYQRIQRSVEKTLKFMWRDKYTNPLYDPWDIKALGNLKPIKEQKKSFDQAFEVYYRKLLW